MPFRKLAWMNPYSMQNVQALSTRIFRPMMIIQTQSDIFMNDINKFYTTQKFIRKNQISLVSVYS